MKCFKSLEIPQGGNCPGVELTPGSWQTMKAFMRLYKSKKRFIESLAERERESCLVLAKLLFARAV